ncbi:hypothetical protein BWQ96_04437 [Gracilariopsis chorda]|uniref:Uncharacterized protein n=1 Tax=Gracilariopsis chorda TaxID=448386 RepID=A0A2V3IXA5_9FLOR|nr:hypothetical protein BWQ96_04437 [Gracilariopsis chorda]|eukprot:PXF45770.1 hypothetical protein BWQ96_04437 [Gracilariopsis chorda]
MPAAKYHVVDKVNRIIMATWPLECASHTMLQGPAEMETRGFGTQAVEW